MGSIDQHDSAVGEVFNSCFIEQFEFVIVSRIIFLNNVYHHVLCYKIALRRKKNGRPHFQRKLFQIISTDLSPSLGMYKKRVATFLL